MKLRRPANSNVKTPKLYGLIGYPLKHTLSPAMHTAAFKAVGIDAQYQPYEIPPAELTSFLSSLESRNISGLNVTVPYKERVFDFVRIDPQSPYLAELGAVNTIVNNAGQWRGFNTDVPGFSRHLKEQIDPRARRVALLGAGGAGKAVAYALAQAQAAQIAVFDTDSDKAGKLVAMIHRTGPFKNIHSVSSVEALDIGGTDILINATPVGLKDSDPSPVPRDLLHSALFVYDLIYNPRQTRLLALAQSAGAKTSNGSGMLLYQGVLAFELFTGRPAPVEVMRKALEEAYP